MTFKYHVIIVYGNTIKYFKSEVQIMLISIYALDADYEDCVIEMGGTVIGQPYSNVIDVQFDAYECGIGMFTDLLNNAVAFTSKNNVGMVIDTNDYASIEIG